MERDEVLDLIVELTLRDALDEVMSVKFKSQHSPPQTATTAAVRVFRARVIRQVCPHHFVVCAGRGRLLQSGRQMCIQERQDRLDPVRDRFARRIQGMQVEARHRESWENSDKPAAGEVL
jgi:hypothetical protein